MKSSTPSELKIFGTFGPQCHTFETLNEMVKAGMNGIRLNTNHKKLEDAREWISNFQKACKENGISGELLIDLKGRALRSGPLEHHLSLESGHSYDLALLKLGEKTTNGLQEGDHFLMDDGAIEATIQNGKLKILRGGLLQAGKNMDLTNREYQRLSLDPADKSQLLAGKALGVQSIMVPFVQNASDLELVSRFLRENNLDYRIYAKIENGKGIENLPEIMPLCDEIVIARGDLASSTGLYNIGWISQLVSQTCREYNKPYMIVTQMLFSMIEKPFPTRAEVNDVFQAVFQGAASIMLTNETAASAYPVEAMQAFCTIASRALCFRNLQAEGPESIAKAYQEMLQAISRFEKEKDFYA